MTDNNVAEAPQPTEEKAPDPIQISLESYAKVMEQKLANTKATARQEYDQLDQTNSILMAVNMDLQNENARLKEAVDAAGSASAVLPNREARRAEARATKAQGAKRT
jgi:hypothetical protein